MRSGQTRGVVVTESEETRRAVEPVLRAAGYRVEHAQGSLDTLRRLAHRTSATVRLLVLDLSNKPWVGLALLEAVRGEDWTLPVVLITGGRALSEGLRWNVQHVIEDPADLAQVMGVGRSSARVGDMSGISAG